MKNILIYKSEGNLCVTHFVKNLNPSQIAEKAENLLPFGTLYRIGTVDELPEDRTFREAWDLDDSDCNGIAGKITLVQQNKNLKSQNISLPLEIQKKQQRAETLTQEIFTYVEKLKSKQNKIHKFYIQKYGGAPFVDEKNIRQKTIEHLDTINLKDSTFNKDLSPDGQTIYRLKDNKFSPQTKEELHVALFEWANDEYDTSSTKYNYPCKWSIKSWDLINLEPESISSLSFHDIEVVESNIVKLFKSAQQADRELQSRFSTRKSMLIEIERFEKQIKENEKQIEKNLSIIKDLDSKLQSIYNQTIEIEEKNDQD